MKWLVIIWVLSYIVFADWKKVKKMFAEYINKQFNMRNLNVVEVEVHGYKERNEDIVVFVVQANEKQRFTTTSAIDRQPDQQVGEAGRDLVQELFGVLPKEYMNKDRPETKYFKARV